MKFSDGGVMAKQVLGFTGLIRDDLARLANALEHVAYPEIVHGKCEICTQKKNAGSKPIKKMPPSRVMSPAEIRQRMEEMRTEKMLAGPEEPVADMFRYRELKNDHT
jgi:hypothetical protein